MVADAVLWLSLFTGTPLALEHAARLPELAPLAESLGFQARGSQIADETFRLLQPGEHAQLISVLPSIESDLSVLNHLHADLQSMAGTDAIVTSRRKSLYSTWTKVERKGLFPAELADRLAARLLLPTPEACYALLTDLHQQYAFDSSQFDDYISSPKVNGYQSIHTVLMLPGEMGVQPVEVQLRTHAMHAAAEHGDAAHWRYKLMA